MQLDEKSPRETDGVSDAMERWACEHVDQPEGEAESGAGWIGRLGNVSGMVRMVVECGRRRKIGVYRFRFGRVAQRCASIEGL